MAQKKKTEFAENGRTDTPVNEIASLISEVSLWGNTPAEDDETVEKRVGEYFNLCASKGEIPIFETLCLYLGTDDETGLAWSRGEGCSSKRKHVLQSALTRMKAIEGKASQRNMIPIATYIWRGKQYFGYREPDPKITLQTQDPLKELPSAISIAQAYLADAEESEAEAEVDA